LVGKHGANGFEIFLGVVLRADVELFDGLTDHDDDPAGRAEAKDQQ
jgi:hypothetical protein